MISVLTCIGSQHNLWLVGLAAVICATGSYVCGRLNAKALLGTKGSRLAWTFLAALVLGTAFWATHFVAMLAYLTPVEVSFDPALTMLSLIVAVAGSNVALTLATRDAEGLMPAIGGALLGITIVGMHLVGMLAFRLEGVVEWDIGLLIPGILQPVVLAAAAMAALRGQLGESGRAAAPGLLMLAVLTMHFTAMAAIKIIPVAVYIPAVADSAFVLALATSLIAALMVAAGYSTYLIDIGTQRVTEERIAALASTDILSGLANRSALEEELARRSPAGSSDEPFGVFLIEITDLDAINQQLGFRIGDLLIRTVARRLVTACSPDVFLARSGGAQFCGIVTDCVDGISRARTLHAALANEFLVEGHVISPDVRLGGAMSTGEPGEPEIVLLHAQTALARAIADPLNVVTMHDGDIDSVAQRRIALANALRGALDRGEFELHFQPQVWIADRHVIGYEALLRWRHPALGLISPTEFIPIAEQTGLILPIGGWALQHACETAARWPSECRVAVNLSPLQLRQADLPQQVFAALAASGLAAHRLELEVTESLFIHDRVQGLGVLRSIRALGVSIVLDDFGTGYSSMELLRQFTFDKVKLDKSFVDDLDRDRRALAILHAMLALGRELCIPILVEGIETERQLAIVRQAGCNKVQGYLTGCPVPVSAIAWPVLRQLCA